MSGERFESWANKIRVANTNKENLQAELEYLEQAGFIDQSARITVNSNNITALTHANITQNATIISNLALIASNSANITTSVSNLSSTIANLSDSFLPLSGGTITGDLNISGDLNVSGNSTFHGFIFGNTYYATRIKRNVDNSYSYIQGGVNDDIGAQIKLGGKDSDGYIEFYVGESAPPLANVLAAKIEPDDSPYLQLPYGLKVNKIYEYTLSSGVSIENTTLKDQTINTSEIITINASIKSLFGGYIYGNGNESLIRLYGQHTQPSTHLTIYSNNHPASAGKLSVQTLNAAGDNINEVFFTNKEDTPYLWVNNGVKVNTIAEYTADHGVDIDGLHIENGIVYGRNATYIQSNSNNITICSSRIITNSANITSHSLLILSNAANITTTVSNLSSTIANLSDSMLPLSGGILTGTLDLNGMTLIIDAAGVYSIVEGLGGSFGIHAGGAPMISITSSAIYNNTVTKIDQITENTNEAGVTIETVVVKDGLVDGVNIAAHKDRHDPNDGADKLDTANAAEIVGVQAAGTGTSHSFARADHVHAINHGIADNHLVTIDHASAADNDYAKFTANGLEGRSYSELRSDINVADGADVTGSNAPQAHKDSHDPNDGTDKLDTAAAAEIAGVQAAGTGTSHSLARADHAHQIQHGIADNHLVTVDSATVANGEYAKFTANGLESKSIAEVKTDLGMIAATEEICLGNINLPIYTPQIVASTTHTAVKMVDDSTDLSFIIYDRPTAPTGFTLKGVFGCLLYSSNLATDAYAELYNVTDSAQVAQVVNNIYYYRVCRSAAFTLPANNKELTVKIWIASSPHAVSIAGAWIDFIAVKD